MALGLIGYITLILELFGLGPLFLLLHLETTPLDLLWYGLYFGILGRDCAEVAADWMVSSFLNLILN